MRHRCLLIFWILITLGCSIKYLYVFFVSDWTSLEDWVSISYLVFYTAVTLVVVAFVKATTTKVTGCPSPTWSSTPPSPWWSSPSRRSAAPAPAVLSTTMVRRQLTRLEEIFYNLCYHLPIKHAFQSSQNRYKWNLLTNVVPSRS